MDEHHLNQTLRNQMKDFEASPPDGAWDNIQKVLKRERKIIFHERLSALMVLLFLTAIILVMIRPFGAQQKYMVNETGGGDGKSEQPQAVEPPNPSDYFDLKGGQDEQTPAGGNRLGMEDIPVQLPEKDIHIVLSIVAKLPLKGPETLLVKQSPQRPTGVVPPTGVPIAPSRNNDEPIIANSVGRFKLFALAMPSLFYHEVETNKSDNSVISNLEQRPAVSGERIGYKAAVGGIWQYRKNLEFSAGLIYAWANESFGFREKTVTGYQTTSLNTENTAYAVVPEFTENESSVIFDRKELGIQLGASLLLLQGKRVRQSVGGNIAFHKNLVNEVETGLSGESIRLSPHYSYMSVFYKIDYRLWRRIDLTLQPAFNYATFINEGETSPLFVRPNNLSLNFGITYQL